MENIEIDGGDLYDLFDPLAQSLSKPRKKIAGKAAGSVFDQTGVVVPSSRFPSLRSDDALEAHRMSALEGEAVKSLPDVVSPTSQSTKKMSGVEKMMDGRKQRQEGAKRDFELMRMRLYSDLENEVLRLGRELTVSFKELDKRAESLLGEVTADVPGSSGWETRDTVWLAGRHSAMRDVQAQRIHFAAIFSESLRGVETRRSDSVSGALQALATDLTTIGYDLPPVISRAIDAYSDELNLVLLNNERARLESVARVDKSVTAAEASLEAKWRECDNTWRSRRHDHVLFTGSQALNSTQFIQPPARTAALDSLHARLRERHAGSRERLVANLLALRPPELTLLVVSEIKAGLEELCSEDALDISSKIAAASAAQEAALEDARSRVEVIRGELHVLCALTPGGGLPRLGAALAEEMECDPLLPSLFRRAGALKTELESLVTAAKSPQLIYSGNLSQLQERVGLMVDSLALGPLAASCGKRAERTVLLKILDSLRTAKRPELPGLLVQLHGLLTSLSTLPGLPLRVVREIESLKEQLGEVLEDIHDRLVEVGLPCPPPLLYFITGAGGAPLTSASAVVDESDGDKETDSQTHTSGGSPRKSTSARSLSLRPKSSMPADGGGGGGGGKQSSAARSESGRRSRASSSSSTSSRSSSSRRRRNRQPHTSILSEMGDAASTVMAAALPLTAMRALQKRAGALVSAAELPSSLQDALRALAAGCERQAQANIAVDAAISSSLSPLLYAREREGLELLEGTRAALKSGVGALRAAGEALCAYFSQVAALWAQHAATHGIIDTALGRVLVAEEGVWKRRVGALEEELGAVVLKAREAPSSLELEKSFTTALGLLEALAGLHSDYKDTVISWAHCHRTRVDSCIRVSRQALLRILGLGLSPDSSLDLDGEEIPGEAIPGALSWSRSGPSPRASTTAEATSEIPSLDVEEDFERATLETEDKLRALAASKAGTTILGGGLRLPLIVPSLVEVLNSQSVLAPLTRALSTPPPPSPPSSSSASDAAAAAPAEDDDKNLDATPPTVEFPVYPQPPPQLSISAAPLQPMDLESAIQHPLHPPRTSPVQKFLQIFTPQRLAHFLGVEGGEVRSTHTPSTSTTIVMPSPPPISYDVTLLATGLSSLRLELVQHFSAYCEERRKIMEELTTARVAVAITEWEERLRSLAPRSGELSMSVKSAREGELCAHVGRLERWVLRTGECVLELEGAVGAGVEGAASGWDRALADLAALKAALTQQNSLASLGGVASRARQVRLAGESALAKDVGAVRRRAKEGIEKLVAGCKEYVGSCVLFSRGGEYAPEELSAVSERIGLVSGEVTAAGASLELLCSQCEAACERDKGIWEDFFAAWELALKKLSLHQGIGPKYGAPKLRAMDLIRVAQGAGEALERGIEGRLEELESLCKLWEETERESLKQAPFPPPPPPAHTIPLFCDSGVTAAAATSVVEESVTLLRSTRGLVEADAEAAGNTGSSRPSSQAETTTTTAAAAAAGKGSTGASKGGDGGKGKAGNAGAGGKAAADTTAAGPAHLVPGLPLELLKKNTTGKTKGSSDEGPSVGALILGLSPEAAEEALRRAYESRAREVDMEAVETQQPPPLSMRIRFSILSLRNSLYMRAKNLEALKVLPDREGPPRTLFLPFISCSDTPPLPETKAPTPAESPPAPPSTVAAFSRGGGVTPEDWLGSVPSIYPSLADSSSFVLPISTPPSLAVSPRLDVPHFVSYLSTPFDELFQRAKGMPHTIKGPSPGISYREAAAHPVFLTTVRNAIGEAFSATRALYEAEGEQVVGITGAATTTTTTAASLDIPGGEDGIPAHLAEWGRDAMLKAVDTRDFSLRRLRVYCERAQEIISLRAPAAVVGDVLARSRHSARETGLRAVTEYRAAAAALEKERREYVSALKLSLGDPNAGERLADLCRVEERRQSSVRALLEDSCKSMLLERCVEGARFAAGLAHNAALLCALCQEVLAPWDLAPLPGDEFIPPQKMSFKKLHKALRRAGGTAANLAAAVLGDSEALEEEDLAVVDGPGMVALLPHQQQTHPPPPSGESSGGKKSATAPPVKKGVASKNAPPTVEATGPPPPPRGARDYLAIHSWSGLHPSPFELFSSSCPQLPSEGSSFSGAFGAITCFLGPASRHTMGTRDAAYAAYCEEFKEACREIRSRFSMARGEAEKWENIWRARVEALLPGETLKDFHATVPTAAVYLIPPPPTPPPPPPPPPPVPAPTTGKGPSKQVQQGKK